MAITITTKEYQELLDVKNIASTLIDSLSYEDYLHKLNYERVDRLRKAIDLVEKRENLK